MTHPALKPQLKLQEKEKTATTTARTCHALYPEAVIRTDEEKQKATNQGKSVLERETAMLKTFKMPSSGPLYPQFPAHRTEEGEGVAGMEPVVVDLVSWQRGKDVLTCNQHMLDKQLVCDVWFRVGAQREGAEGGGERVGAHTYVLRSRSSEFYVMLAESWIGEEGRESGAGGCGQQQSVADIDLPHTNPRVFWQLLRYLYYEHLQLEEDTVLELLMLAETYDVKALRAACLRFLQESLTVGTACSSLETAHRCDDQQLTNACRTFLREHGQDVVRSSGVGDLCRECLNKVLTLEGLELTPSERQEAADRWASLQCQNHLVETTRDNKQKTLGDVLYVKKDTQESRRFFSDDIAHPERFYKTRRELASSQSGRRASTTSREPVSVSLASLFSTRSKTSTASTISARSTNSLTMGSVPRTPSSSSTGSDFHQVTRFKELNDASRVPNNGTADAVSFSVDHDILLYGFGIYSSGDSVTAGEDSPAESSSPTSFTYTVDTAVSKRKKDMVLESIVISGAGVILPVMLHKPVMLKRGKTYTLAVYVQGPPSLSGAAGRSGVRGETGGGGGGGGGGGMGGGGGSGDGVTFFFSQASPPVRGNRTGVRKGQIPRLYYLPY